MSLEDTIARHERIVLEFSGGKDSLATLYLLKPWWDKIAICWCNPGAAFPETLEIMERVKQLPVDFHEVRPYLAQPESVWLHGLPADMVPLKHLQGRTYQLGVETEGPLIQDFLSCCNRLLFQPLQGFVREYQATLVIRGQRNDEPMRGPTRDGMVDEDGVEYCLPLQDWTEPQVFDFLREQGVEIPAHYAEVAHSLDCWSCTAYLDQSLDKLDYIKRRHPERWAVLAPRIEAIHAAVCDEKQHLDGALAIARSPS